MQEGSNGESINEYCQGQQDEETGMTRVRLIFFFTEKQKNEKGMAAYDLRTTHYKRTVERVSLFKP
jgi:hypothetical protein